MRNVAYICSLFPTRTETFVLREVEQLTRMGWPVTCFSLRRNAEVPPDEELQAWRQKTVYPPFLFSIGLLKANFYFLCTRPLRYIQCFLALWRNTTHPHALVRSLAIFPIAVWFAGLVQKEKISRIHAHFANVPATSAWIIGRLAGVLFSFTAHAFDIFSNDYRDSLLPRKVRDADFVVCISEYNRQHLESTLASAGAPAGRLVVIHCGVDVKTTRGPAARPSVNKVPTILSIGRLTEKKGHTYLIKALSLLRTKGERFRCLIVGEGPLNSTLRAQIADLKLQECISLLGELPHQDVEALLEEADIFCLACVVAKDGDRDGIPVSLMEAMARGIPVVSTSVSGIPELVCDETGILVPERDPAALAAAIETLLGQPEYRRTLGNRARERILDGFSAEANAKKLASLFSFDVT